MKDIRSLQRATEEVRGRQESRPCSGTLKLISRTPDDRKL